MINLELLDKEEILKRCNEIAISYCRKHGFLVPSTAKMYECEHPQERGFWLMAVEACEILLGVDVWDIVDEINLEKEG